MTKGRKLTTSLSERYLGAYAGHSHTHAVSADSSDFSEEDVVWSSTVDNAAQFDHYGNGHAPESEWESRASNAPRSPTVGGLSLAFEDPSGTTPSRLGAQDGVVLGVRRQQRHMATSAPMSVPDWGRILRVDSAESMQDSDGGCFADELDSGPPHEYLARSRKLGATSVFEGVGRTLKGRDMSRLRDAVWSQTGFDG